MYWLEELESQWGVTTEEIETKTHWYSLSYLSLKSLLVQTIKSLSIQTDNFHHLNPYHQKEKVRKQQWKTREWKVYIVSHMW